MAEEQRPIPVGPGERTSTIGPARNSLASMFAKGMNLEDIKRQAPESHRQMDRRMGVRTEEEARALSAAELDKPLIPPAAKPTTAVRAAKHWQRGDQARYGKLGKVVTILAARVRVNEDGIPYHKVAAGGESWLAKDTKLKPVR